MSLRSWVVAALLLATGCAEDDGPDGPPPDFEPPSLADTVGVTPELDAELPLLLTSTVTRTGSANGAALGTARLLRTADAGSSLTLTIELSDLGPGTHAWELRNGPCPAAEGSPEQAGDSGPAMMSGTISAAAGGFAEASSLLPSTAIDAEEIGRGRYRLVIVGADTRSVLACADL